MRAFDIAVTLFRKFHIGARTTVSGVALACLIAGAPLFGQQRAHTLRGLLEHSVAAFSGGDYVTAAALFEELENTFGRETEYRKEAVQAAVLPMRAYAFLLTGRADYAIADFETYIRSFPANESGLPFVLFALAQAYHLSGDVEAAVDTYIRFMARFPRTPEAALAALRVASLEHSRGHTTDAVEALNRLYANEEASFTLRQQARLRALQLLLDGGDEATAGEILLETSWSIAAMPERSVLAFAALRLGDGWMAAGEPSQALAAYRMVPPLEALREMQATRLRETQQSFEARRAAARTFGAGPTTVWLEYYEGVIGRLESLLQQLETMDDYTAPFLLRFGMAFLQSGRAREAAIVFRDLAEGNWVVEIRREGHYRWILALQEQEAWDTALSVANAFLERYPDSTEAPATLFLIANAYQKQRRYGEAVDGLSRLMETFPDHRLATRWLFSRGINFLFLEAYAAARHDFAAFREQAGQEPLADNAAVWHALSWFFENQHAAAYEEFRILVERLPRDHHLAAESSYRLAASLYGMRRHEKALQAIEAYLAAYSEDRFQAEARVLRGDILMALARLDEAVEAFSAVGPEAGRLFPYAVFQVGKIHRAREDYDGMIAHFTAYAGRDDLEVHPRLGEALHWVGWAYLQRGELELALPVFQSALTNYGNDRAQDEIQAILGSLERLHARLARTHPDALFARAPFEEWLASQAETASAGEQALLRARLELYRSGRLRSFGREDEADALLLAVAESAAPELLGPEELGIIGLRLAELDFLTAEDYLEVLLEVFPTSPRRGLAYLGHARLALRVKNPREAIPWLERFLTELPGHPRAVEARLLLGQALAADNRYERSQEEFDEILRLREARGRPHAEALTGLAGLMSATDRPERAIGYYQRIYNMYRAHPDLAAEAYRESARLFEERGDLRAAWRTWEEFLRYAEDHRPESRAEARAAVTRLETLLPPEPDPDADERNTQT